jgi:hypothetical protein
MKDVRMKLLEMILNEMKNVSKNQKSFVIILMETILSIYGHVNFRSLSRHSGLSEKTFRRWFKIPFDFCEFNSKAIDQVLKPESEVIAAFDQSFEDKAGNKTWGKASFWNGCASRAEKGLELVLCAIVDVGNNIAYALEADQTPPENELKGAGVDTILENLTRMDFYLSCIEKVHLAILKYTKYFVFDGYFTKKNFVDRIVLLGFHVIGKLRCDADLKILYTGEQKKGRGRPRKFAGKCKIKELEGFTFEGNFDEETKLYSGIFYHASLQRIIKVVAVVHARKNKIGIALIFSTDTTLDAFKIHRYYKARFQIEFVFRDAGQFAGLGDCQSRNKESLRFHFNASFMALNLVKIQYRTDCPNNKDRVPFSMASYKTKFHNESMISRFFSMLGFELSSIKIKPVYNEILNYGTINFRGG